MIIWDFFLLVICPILLISFLFVKRCWTTSVRSRRCCAHCSPLSSVQSPLYRIYCLGTVSYSKYPWCIIGTVLFCTSLYSPLYRVQLHNQGTVSYSKYPWCIIGTVLICTPLYSPLYRIYWLGTVSYSKYTWCINCTISLMYYCHIGTVLLCTPLYSHLRTGFTAKVLYPI